MTRSTRKPAPASRALPADLPARLSSAGVYVSVRGTAIRVSPHLYNTQEDVDRIREGAEKEVDRAIAFAEASPEPAPEDALTDVYVAYR